MNKPMPVVVSFVMCREMFQDQAADRLLLLDPGTDVIVPHFPYVVRRGFYLEFTSGHGDYRPRLELRDLQDNTVWSWSAPGTFAARGPLELGTVIFKNNDLCVPYPGRFEIVLLLDNVEVARRPLRVSLQGAPPV
jgi:hypothetical protein